MASTKPKKVHMWAAIWKGSNEVFLLNTKLVELKSDIGDDNRFRYLAIRERAVEEPHDYGVWAAVHRTYNDVWRINGSRNALVEDIKRDLDLRRSSFRIAFLSGNIKKPRRKRKTCTKKA